MVRALLKNADAQLAGGSSEALFTALNKSGLRELVKIIDADIDAAAKKTGCCESLHGCCDGN